MFRKLSFLTDQKYHLHFARILSADGDDGGDQGNNGGGGTGGDQGDQGGKSDGGDKGGGSDDGNDDIDDGLLGRQYRTPADKGDKGGKADDKGDGSADEKVTIGADGRPSNIPEQFWDAKTKSVNSPALLKAFNDTKAAHDKLVAKAGGTPPEKPEEYLTGDFLKDGKLQRPEGVVNARDVPANDPGLVGFAAIAHKHGLTPKQFQGIVAETMVLADKFVPKPLDPDAELRALGPNGINVVSGVKTWLDGLVDAKKIDVKTRNNAIRFGRTAEGMKTLLAFRNLSGAKPIPLGEAVDGTEELPTREQWYANMPDREKDPDAYEKWRAQGEKIFGTGPGGSSPSGLGVPASRSASRRSIEARKAREAKSKGA